MITPKRGEVWLVDLGMAAKVRPALVLSVPAGDDDRALATLVPHTTSVRGTQFEATVSVGFLKTGAFDARTSSPFRTRSFFDPWASSIRSNLLTSKRPCDLGWAFPLVRSNMRCSRRARAVNIAVAPAAERCR